MKHFIKHVIAIAAVALLPVAASAQAWAPTKAITFVVPVAPGSSNDLIARMLSEKLPARLGQPVHQRQDAARTGRLPQEKRRHQLRQPGHRLTHEHRR